MSLDKNACGELQRSNWKDAVSPKGLASGAKVRQQGKLTLAGMFVIRISLKCHNETNLLDEHGVVGYSKTSVHPEYRLMRYQN